MGARNCNSGMKQAQKPGNVWGDRTNPILWARYALGVVCVTDLRCDTKSSDVSYGRLVTTGSP